jgi:fimbrial chaperone protein
MKLPLSLLAALLLAAGPAAAFEMSVAPSRVEVAGKAGGRIGQSLQLTNVGSQQTEVAVHTLDWSFSPEGNITFHDELRPGSCRPWVTLERRVVRIAPQASVPFRFQIDVPPDAPRGECRFMLAVEGVEPAYRAQIAAGGTSLSLPVNGRIAIAVYVEVNGAEPKFEFKGIGVSEVAGKRQPVITLSNTGDAHGRIEGSLSATDAKGRKFELIPDSSPLLPGQTRTLVLQPRTSQQVRQIEPAFPLKADGQLDWDLGSFKVDVELQ